MRFQNSEQLMERYWRLSSEMVLNFVVQLYLRKAVSLSEANLGILATMLKGDM